MSENTELDVHDNMRIDHEREEHGGYDAEREERPLSAREQAMADISKRREEAINRELRMGEEYADQARENAGLEAHPKQEEESALDAQAKEILNKPVEDKPKQVLHEIELDGQVYNVTEDQFRELAKLGARTNVAMARQQQAAPQQQYHNQQPAQRPQQQQAPQQPDQQQAARRSVLSKTDAEAVADRLLYGGREQVAQTVEALANHIHQQSRQEQINAEAVAAEAARRAMDYTEVNNALQTISGEYPGIWANRALGELAAVQLNHLRAEDQATGKTRNHLDSYREACNRVLDALGQPRPNGSAQQPATQAALSNRAPAQSSDRSAVLERKRVAKTEPSAIDRRASAPTVTRPLSGAEIVAQMRKARHQSAYN